MEIYCRQVIRQDRVLRIEPKGIVAKMAAKISSFPSAATYKSYKLFLLLTTIFELFSGIVGPGHEAGKQKKTKTVDE